MSPSDGRREHLGFVGLGVAADLSFSCRWFPSEGNAADTPSRRFARRTPLFHGCSLKSQRCPSIIPVKCQLYTEHSNASLTIRVPGGARLELQATPASCAPKARTVKVPLLLLRCLAFRRIWASTRFRYIEALGAGRNG